MNKIIEMIIRLFLFVLLLFTAYAAYTTLSEKYQPSTVTPESSLSADATSEPNTTTNTAPDFTVFDSEGTKVHLTDFTGKPVVLNFWASWCPPCKSEMPDFNEVYTSLTNDDIIFMMIDLTDGTRETQADGQAHIDKQGYSFPVYFDNEQSAASAYGISSIPTTILIDSEGNIVDSHLGMIDKETLIEGIRKITK